MAMHAMTEILLFGQVDREQTTGAVNMVFAGTHITNAYNNLTNIIIYIAPKEAAHSKAVMINAHFDSVFESPGTVQQRSPATALHVTPMLAPGIPANFDGVWH